MPDGYKLPMDFDVGSSHIAFDGQVVFYAKPRKEYPNEEEGMIKQFNWQSRDDDLTLFQEMFQVKTGLASNFDPGVLRYEYNTDILVFSDRGRRDSDSQLDTLYFWQNPKLIVSDPVEIYAENGCIIIDVAVEKSPTDTLETLILTRCRDFPPEVKKFSVDPTDFTTVEDEAFNWETNILGEARSIEWITKEVSRHRAFFLLPFSYDIRFANSNSAIGLRGGIDFDFSSFSNKPFLRRL